MEAVARQFARGKKIFICRNGFFSFRWTEIIDMCEITSPENVTVFKAQNVNEEDEFHTLKP